MADPAHDYLHLQEAQKMPDTECEDLRQSGAITLGGARLGPDRPSDFDIRKAALAFVIDGFEIGGAEVSEMAADYVDAAKIFEAYLRGDDKTEA